MSLIVPKIVYGGGPTTLTFKYPPKDFPYSSYKAVRHDNLSSAGVRESIYERTDSFLKIKMEYVTLGSDVAAWDAFIQWALPGAPFSFYPDSTLSAHSSYVLEDTDFTIAFKQLGEFTFNCAFRSSVGWP